MIENIQFAQVGNEDKYKFQSEKFYVLIEHATTFFTGKISHFWDWNVYNNEDEEIETSEVNFEIVPDAVESFKRHYEEILADHPELKPSKSSDREAIFSLPGIITWRKMDDPSYSDLLWAVQIYGSMYTEQNVRSNSFNKESADRLVGIVNKVLKGN